MCRGACIRRRPRSSSRRACTHDTYDGLPVHDFNVRRAAELRERLLRTYHVSRVEDLPVNFRGMDYLEREAHSNAVWDRHYAALWTAFDRQTAVHHMAGWVAPLMAVRALSMALAGVDIFHHRDFAMEAEAYRRRLVLAMNSALAHGAGSRKLGAYTADASLWSSVEPFAYRQPDITWALGHVRSEIGALAAWALLTCAALCPGGAADGDRLMAKSLFPVIARHELRLLTRGRTASVALLLIAVTVAYAAWSGTRWRREQLDTIARIQQQDERLYATIADQLEEIARHGDPRPELQLAGMAVVHLPAGRSCRSRAASRSAARRSRGQRVGGGAARRISRQRRSPRSRSARATCIRTTRA